jgi:hypothetical protein
MGEFAYVDNIQENFSHIAAPMTQTFKTVLCV